MRPQETENSPKDLASPSWPGAWTRQSSRSAYPPASIAFVASVATAVAQPIVHEAKPSLVKR